MLCAGWISSCAPGTPERIVSGKHSGMESPFKNSTPLSCNISKDQMRGGKLNIVHPEFNVKT